MTQANTFSLPHNWTPWPHQEELFRALDDGFKRIYLLWHRQAGKDEACLHALTKKAVEVPGNYYLLAPTATQGRDIYWDKRDSSGMRQIDHAVPEAIRVKIREDTMTIVVHTTEPGKTSTIQVKGYEDFDRRVGISPKGVVFTEWSVSDTPAAWEYMEPAIRRNNGWVIFNTTPRGMNHAFKLWSSVQDRKDWWTSLKTIRDTGLVEPEEIERDVRDGLKSRAQADSEYYCKWISQLDQVVVQPEDIARGISATLDMHPLNHREPLIAGIDIALGGGDFSRIRYRRGFDAVHDVPPPIRMDESDPDQLKARIAHEMKRTQPDYIQLDATGLGMPIARSVRNLGFSVGLVTFNSPAQDKAAGLLNRRIEMYDRLARWLRAGGCLPDEPRLTEELSHTPYEFDSHGKRKMRPKWSFKEVLGRSPDDADSLALTFADEVNSDIMQIRNRRRGGQSSFALM